MAKLAVRKVQKLSSNIESENSDTHSLSANDANAMKKRRFECKIDQNRQNRWTRPKIVTWHLASGTAKTAGRVRGYHRFESRVCRFEKSINSAKRHPEMGKSKNTSATYSETVRRFGDARFDGESNSEWILRNVVGITWFQAKIEASRRPQKPFTVPNYCLCLSAETSAETSTLRTGLAFWRAFLASILIVLLHNMLDSMQYPSYKLFG